jgi:hypothetical protein
MHVGILRPSNLKKLKRRGEENEKRPQGVVRTLAVYVKGVQCKYFG